MCYLYLLLNDSQCTLMCYLSLLLNDSQCKKKQKLTYSKAGNPVVRVVDLPQPAVDIASSRVDREVLGHILCGVVQRVDNLVVGRADVCVTRRHSHNGLPDGFGLQDGAAVLRDGESRRSQISAHRHNQGLRVSPAWGTSVLHLQGESIGRE